MWKDVFKNRELLWELAKKNLEARYRNPVLGFLWSILTPLSMILIFLFVFSKIIRIEIKDIPYSIYIVTGIFTWSFFQASVNQATTSVLDNATLVKKVYFPRVLIPCSAVLSSLIDFLIGMVLLILILPFFKVRYSFFILYTPLVILLQIFFAAGFSLLFSSLYVRFRDIRYLAEIILMVLFYSTPAFYPLELVLEFSATAFNLYMLNPFVGILTLYRIVLIRGFIDTLPAGTSLSCILISPLIGSAIILLSGILVFKRLEPRFADYV